MKYRLELTKGEEIRYISHLDYAELIRRAILRAKLPVAYSEGFNPHLKMTFLAALALGVTSSAEYMDIEFDETAEEITPFVIASRLAKQLPPSVTIHHFKKINPNAPLRKAQPDYAVYLIAVPLLPNENEETLKNAIAAFNEADTALINRVTPKKRQTFDAKTFLAGPVTLEVQPPAEENFKKAAGDYVTLRLNIHLTPNGSVKPSEILKLLREDFEAPLDIDSALIHRVSLLCKGKSPLKCIQ